MTHSGFGQNEEDRFPCKKLIFNFGEKIKSELKALNQFKTDSIRLDNSFVHYDKLDLEIASKQMDYNSNTGMFTWNKGLFSFPLRQLLEDKKIDTVNLNNLSLKNIPEFMLPDSSSIYINLSGNLIKKIPKWLLKREKQNHITFNLRGNPIKKKQLMKLKKRGYRVKFGDGYCNIARYPFD